MIRTSSLMFAALLVFVAGCSKQQEADMMGQAMKLVESKKFDEAVTLYQKVADEYPESNSAPMALYAKALVQLNDLKSPEQAIATFQQVSKNYPDSEYGHKCLFMTGFVFANNLRQPVKAKDAYKQYLEKYADSSMAETARFELEHLGKSPEEILKDLQDSTRSDTPKSFVHP